MTRVPKSWLLKYIDHVEIRSDNTATIPVSLDEFKELIGKRKTPPGGFKTNLGGASAKSRFEWGHNDVKNGKDRGLHRTIRVYIEGSDGRIFRHYDVRNYP